MSVNPDCSVAPIPAHGVVEFEPAAFRALYPAFTNPPTTDGQLQLYFDLATQILSNTCRSVVSDGTIRERLLNLLVAHIATLLPLSTGGGAGGGAGLVGAITEATEGSVKVSAQWLSEVSQSMAWFILTPYGQLFWQMTAIYRSFRYVTPPQCCAPLGPYGSGLIGRRGW